MNRPIRRFPVSEFTYESGCAQKLKKPKPVIVLITTKLKGRETVPQIVYFLAFAVVGVPLCIKTLLTKPLPEPKTTLLLLVLGFISISHSCYIAVKRSFSPRLSPSHGRALLSRHFRSNPRNSTINVALYHYEEARDLELSVQCKSIYCVFVYLRGSRLTGRLEARRSCGRW